MSSNTQHLLSDEKPWIPGILAIVAAMIPTIAVLLEQMGAVSGALPELAVLSAFVFPPIVYFAVRRAFSQESHKALVQQLLPLSTREVARTLWWRVLGFPAVALLAGGLADGAAMQFVFG